MMINSTRYLTLSNTSLVQDLRIREKFAQAYNRGQWLQVWSLISGNSRCLLSSENIQPACIENIHQKEGIQFVPINQIRGSEGRVHDFDRDFNPLVVHIQERWLRIADAKGKGKYLPAVILVKVGNIYFVRDGHHRISVARAFGETSIEAKVIVWQVNGHLAWDVPSILISRTYPNLFTGLRLAYQWLLQAKNRLYRLFIIRGFKPTFNYLKED